VPACLLAACWGCLLTACWMRRAARCSSGHPWPVLRSASLCLAPMCPCICCRSQQFDVPQQLEGLPEMKPEDQQYFGKLLKVGGYCQDGTAGWCFWLVPHGRTLPPPPLLLLVHSSRWLAAQDQAGAVAPPALLHNASHMPRLWPASCPDPPCLPAGCG
jgi:hypothetical protein